MSKDTFEQKIRQADLEFNKDEPMVVKLGDLVELLNKRDNEMLYACRFSNEAIEWENRYKSLLAQALQEKPCKCSKYLDLRA